MNLAWAVPGAVLGALAGAVLRGPVFRLSVPSGEPERTACPRGGTGLAARPIGRWGHTASRAAGSRLGGRLAVRCRECGGFFGPPWALEVVTAVVLALVCARFA